MSLAEFHGLLQKAEVQLCSAFLKSAFSECWTLCGQHVWTLFFWTLDFACQQTFWIESQVCDLFRVMYDCRSWWHLDLSFSLSLCVYIYSSRDPLETHGFDAIWRAPIGQHIELRVVRMTHCEPVKSLSFTDLYEGFCRLFGHVRLQFASKKQRSDEKWYWWCFQKLTKPHIISKSTARQMKPREFAGSGDAQQADESAAVSWGTGSLKMGRHCPCGSSIAAASIILCAEAFLTHHD